MMSKFLSYLFIIVGLGLLIYGGGKLIQSYINEGKRLEEARSFINEHMKSNANQKESEIDLDFKKGETIGLLYIPRLDRELPIIEGTDEEELAVGVGHFTDTGFPGENKQILLSGHRDTVFRQFGELEHGDEFHIQMKHGTFIYEFQDFEIVSADNRTVIDPARKDEYLTISTCYPFSFIGSAPDRYVIYAFPKG